MCDCCLGGLLPCGRGGGGCPLDGPEFWFTGGPESLLESSIEPEECVPSSCLKRRVPSPCSPPLW